MSFAFSFTPKQDSGPLHCTESLAPPLKDLEPAADAARPVQGTVEAAWYSMTPPNISEDVEASGTRIHPFGGFVL